MRSCETSQLFARTVAGIDPEWVVELGAHLCEFRYTEPHWSAKAGRVLVLERVLVHGLEVARRLVDYGRIDPAQATELFIRGALVAEEARLPHRFFAENRKVRDKIETALTRVRSRRAHDLDESLYQFYAARIEGVSSVHDLNRLVRDRITREPDFLCATEADLIGDDDASYDRALFPDHVSLGNTALPLTYAYTPGDETDGVTVRVPLPVAAQLTSGQLQWMVPGLREEQIAVLLRALPKTVRKPLMPLEPKIREIAARVSARPRRLSDRARGVPHAQIRPARARRRLARAKPARRICIRAWKWWIAAIRQSPQAAISARSTRKSRATTRRPVRGKRPAQKWERAGVTSWSFGDLPESIVVEEIAGAPLLAFPGLSWRDGAVDVRLFRKREEAEAASRAGVRGLGELVLAKDFDRVRKDFANLARTLARGGKPSSNFHDALHQLQAPTQPLARRPAAQDRRPAPQRAHAPTHAALPAHRRALRSHDRIRPPRLARADIPHRRTHPPNPRPPPKDRRLAKALRHARSGPRTPRPRRLSRPHAARPPARTCSATSAPSRSAPNAPPSSPPRTPRKPASSRRSSAGKPESPSHSAKLSAGCSKSSASRSSHRSSAPPNLSLPRGYEHSADFEIANVGVPVFGVRWEASAPHRFRNVRGTGSGNREAAPCFRKRCRRYALPPQSKGPVAVAGAYLPVATLSKTGSR